MAIAVVGMIVTRNLFAVIVLSGSYSFLMATVLVALDAVDVSMTEASVGAGVSTLVPAGISWTTGCEKPSDRFSLSPWAWAL